MEEPRLRKTRHAHRSVLLVLESFIRCVPQGHYNKIPTLWGWVAESPERVSSALELLLFLFNEAVDLLDVPVGELLDVFLRLELLVLADLLVILELFDRLVRVAPQRPDVDPPFLGQLVAELDQFLPPLTRQRWDGQPDDLAVHHGGDAEPRLLDGLFDLRR